jgi:hypothetical protein
MNSRVTRYLKMGTEPFGGCNRLHPGLCSGITFASHPATGRDERSSDGACERLEGYRVCDSFHKNFGCLRKSKIEEEDCQQKKNECCAGQQKDWSTQFRMIALEGCNLK